MQGLCKIDLSLKSLVPFISSDRSQQGPVVVHQSQDRSIIEPMKPRSDWLIGPIRSIVVPEF
jgi:hypothetical protein